MFEEEGSLWFQLQKARDRQQALEEKEATKAAAKLEREKLRAKLIAGKKQTKKTTPSKIFKKSREPATADGSTEDQSDEEESSSLRTKKARSGGDSGSKIKRKSVEPELDTANMTVCK